MSKTSRKTRQLQATRTKQPRAKIPSRTVQAVATPEISIAPKDIATTPKPTVKRPATRLPSVWALTNTVVKLLWEYRRPFLGIMVVYGLLSLFLVEGLNLGSSVSTLKQQFSGVLGPVASSAVVFMNLVGNAGNGPSDTAGIFHVLLLVTASLAIIWALRQVKDGLPLTARDSYYRGMYPLVPFLLVLVVVGLQLLPFIIGATIYTTVISNGVAIGGLEKLIFLLIFAGLTALSFYLVSASLFGFYAVAEPEMRPRAALRAARKLVHHRRLLVLRKLLFLPLLLLVATAVIMLPVIMVLAPLAPWLFFLLTLLMLPIVHAYMYTLYGELGRETATASNDTAQ